MLATFFAASVALRTPQVLRLRDATTLQQISLVGTVHYNSASIARAREEASADPLGAVVVEACMSRWKKSLELAPPGSVAARLIGSEMQAAAGAAAQKDVPVMLGDSDVGPFLLRVKALARDTVRQLADPLGGGWRAIYADLDRTLRSTFDTADIAASELLLEGELPLAVTDFARPDIALGFALSLARYPTAFALKAPIPFAGLCASIFALGTAADTADAAAAAAVGAGDLLSPVLVATALLAAAEAALVVLLGRLLLVAFLEERNAELARSIRRAAAESDAPCAAAPPRTACEQRCTWWQLWRTFRAPSAKRPALPVPWQRRRDLGRAARQRGGAASDVDRHATRRRPRLRRRVVGRYVVSVLMCSV